MEFDREVAIRAYLTLRDLVFVIVKFHITGDSCEITLLNIHLANINSMLMFKPATKDRKIFNSVSTLCQESFLCSCATRFFLSD